MRWLGSVAASTNKRQQCDAPYTLNQHLVPSNQIQNMSLSVVISKSLRPFLQKWLWVQRS